MVSIPSPKTDRVTGRRRWWPWIALGLLLVALCFGWFLLPLRAWLNGLQAWLHGLGPWGVAILVLLIVAMTFLPAPDWPLPIAAGYVYGVWALPLVFVSTAFAASLAFLTARYLARDRVRAMIRRRPKYRAIDKAVAEEGWQVVLLLRLSPFVPFNLQNYAFGATAIPFRQYFTATLLGILPGDAIYVYFGIFGKGFGKPHGAVDWVLLGLGLVAAAVLALLVTRKTKEKFSEAEDRAPAKRAHPCE
jgi:uncharacterized membrane protein YdjX (TVP38/TMEM64 family)